ncbi:MAG TPA: 6,7-dimethyl-8-ribityllumazine synthase [Longimicrobiaceae bacterium]|nr:6,7-dimethyl-8-ribityllumazine synthase [Longimicrobiaceae bacterium]
MKGQPSGKGRRIAIVVSRFNEVVTSQLLQGAHETLLSAGVAEDAIEVAWVPGAWEIPSTLRRFGCSGRFDALIGLGAVIRGGTPHFEYVSRGVADGIAEVGTETELPVIFGVLTTDTLEQALERAGGRGADDSSNKGTDAALAALEMIDIFRQMDERDNSEGT